MICPYCHSEIEDDALFCSECGKRLEPQAEEEFSAQEPQAGKVDPIQEPQEANPAQEPWEANPTQGLQEPYSKKREQEYGYRQPENTGKVRKTTVTSSSGKQYTISHNTEGDDKRRRAVLLGLGAAAVVLLVVAAVVITNVMLNKKDEQTAEKEALLADVTAGTEEKADGLRDELQMETDGQKEENTDGEDADTAVNAEDSQAAEQEGDADSEGTVKSDSENAEGTPIPTAQPLDLGPDPASITAELLKKAPKDYVRLEVATASSSSELVQEGTDPNNAWMVLDQKDETSWQENVSGSGIGETLDFSFSGEQKVKYMSFKLGNWRDDRYYKGNNIPETLKIRMGELEFSVTFPKKQKEYWVELSEAYPTYDVQVEIVSVYAGTSWDDTPIAEIGMYGE